MHNFVGISSFLFLLQLASPSAISLDRFEFSEKTQNIAATIQEKDIAEVEEGSNTVEGNGSDAEDTAREVDIKVDSDLHHSGAAIEDNELAEEEIEKDMIDFEELKARIYLLEIHLRQIAKYNSLKENDKFVKETDATLKEIDYEVIKPSEEKLMKLRTQIKESNLELEDELRSSADFIVKDSEISIQESREKLKVMEKDLEKVWEESDESEKIKLAKTRDDLNKPIDGVGDGFVKKEGINSYDEMKSRNNLYKHQRLHEDENKLAQVTSELDEAGKHLDLSSVAYSSLHPFLIPGLTMLVFLFLCSAVAFTLTRRRGVVASRMVSQALGRNTGYTELETVGERKRWDSMGQFNGQQKSH